MIQLRTRNETVAVRLHPRTLTVSGILLAALLGVAALTLTTGSYPLSLSDVLAALVGQGEGGAGFIVNELRLPRLLTAVFVGAGLAVSGAVLQSLSRNPLGSPDIIGFTNGSATGALIVIVTVNGSMLQIAGGALVGGIMTAALIYLLAFTGGLHGFRFILVGIGINAMALAANSFLITRASLQEALAAKAWLVGSLNGRGWTQALAMGAVVAVLVPLTLYLSRRLALLELGDEMAEALGIAVGRTKLLLIVVSVALVAMAAAATGPITFVALAAPQLARKLTRASGPVILPAALMGALLLATGDQALQLLLPNSELPVGVATGTIGGLYLIWFLSTHWRRTP